MNDAEETRRAAETYFDAWRQRDFERLRTVLDDGVEFTGVLGTAHGVDECIAGLQGMANGLMDDLVLHARVVEGSDAMTWFDLVAKGGAVVPTVNWSHVENGRVTDIKVTFDPRPLL